MFDAFGSQPNKGIVTYCQGSIRAAHTVLALKLASYEKVRNYEGSWGAWSRRDFPPVAPSLRQTSKAEVGYRRSG